MNPLFEILPSIQILRDRKYYLNPDSKEKKRKLSLGSLF
jgi:hypothetical protein